MNLTLRTATGKLVKLGKRLCGEGCNAWRGNLQVRGVQAPVCKPLLSVGEYTTMGGAAVMYGDKGYLFRKGSNVAKKMESWVLKEISSSPCHNYMKLPTSQSSGGLPAGSEPVIQRIHRIQVGGWCKTRRIRKRAVDGQELTISRVPLLPPELCARQIAEHELTGHAVYRSWYRHRAHAHPSRKEGELPKIGVDYGWS